MNENIIIYAIPFFLLMIALEWWAAAENGRFVRTERHHE